MVYGGHCRSFFCIGIILQCKGATILKEGKTENKSVNKYFHNGNVVQWGRVEEFLVGLGQKACEVLFGMKGIYICRKSCNCHLNIVCNMIDSK